MQPEFSTYLEWPERPAVTHADVAGLLDALGRHRAADVVRWSQAHLTGPAATDVETMAADLAAVTEQYAHAESEVERLRAAMCDHCRNAPVGDVCDG